LADLEQVLVRLLATYPALEGISIAVLVQEIWAEIARPAPRLHAIAHRVEGAEHLVPLTNRQGMPRGFAQSFEWPQRRIIITGDGWDSVNEDGQPLIDWQSGMAVRAANERYWIELYTSALEQWVAIRVMAHLPRRPSRPRASPSRSVIDLGGTISVVGALMLMKETQQGSVPVAIETTPGPRQGEIPTPVSAAGADASKEASTSMTTTPSPKVEAQAESAAETSSPTTSQVGPADKPSVQDTPQRKSNASARPLRRNRGREPKYAWAAFDQELSRRMESKEEASKEEAFKTWQEMIDWALPWCLDKWGEEPAESTIREHVERKLPEVAGRLVSISWRAVRGKSRGKSK
jgi:hypothetical protein